MKVVLSTLTTTSEILKHSDRNCTSGLLSGTLHFTGTNDDFTKAKVEIDTSHPLVSNSIALFLLFFKLLEHAIPSSFIIALLAVVWVYLVS